jgi:long-subunit acyl-CoA synthetase (AMP-forming)
MQAGDIRTSLGSGLLQLGITPKSMLGLYSVNCKEWVLLDAAAHAYSMVSVPLYDTLGPDAVEYICNHAELAAVGCSAAVLPTLLSCIARCPTVKLLVSLLVQRGPAERRNRGALSSRTYYSCAFECGVRYQSTDIDLVPLLL